MKLSKKEERESNEQDKNLGKWMKSKEGKLALKEISEQLKKRDEEVKEERLKRSMLPHWYEPPIYGSVQTPINQFGLIGVFLFKFKIHFFIIEII